MRNQEETMLAIIRDYRVSGKALAAYCAENGLTVDKMKYWMYVRKLEQKPMAAEILSNGTKDFVSIDLFEGGKTGPGLTLEIMGITITIERGFDKALLLEVAEALTA